MTICTPSIWDITLNLRDLLDLCPHVGDGELSPLWHLHGGDLEVPEHKLGAIKDLMEEANGTILLIW